MTMIPSRQKTKSLKRLNAIKGVYNDLMQGATASVVMGKLMEGSYEGSQKYKKYEAYKIFHEAKELVIIDFEMERPYLKEQLYLYLLDIYTECRESKDKYNAIQAINSIAKLTGIYEDNKKPLINIESEGGVKISFGFNNEEDVSQEVESELIEEDGNQD